MGKQHEPIPVEDARVDPFEAVSTRRVGSAGPAIGNQLKPTQQCKTTPEDGQRPARKSSRRGGEGRAGPHHLGLHARCPSPHSQANPAQPHTTYVTQRFTGEKLRIKEAKAVLLALKK